MKHEATLGAQLAEKIQHEADVAVLRVELRLVEQMHFADSRCARRRAGMTACRRWRLRTW